VKKYIEIILDEKQGNYEKEEHAWLCVYHVLSLHPALDNMKPPMEILVNFDWRVGLGPCDHFWRTSQIGEQGRRARIMILLCWVIGLRLPQDRVHAMVLDAVADAIATVETSSQHLVLMLELYWVKRVLERLVTMIITRLPAPFDNNSFYGGDFIAYCEDEPILHSNLWAYNEDPGQG
jgi:hypothetical protein